MPRFFSSKNKDKAPHRGAGMLFAAGSVVAVTNAAAVESTGNTVMDTVRYGVSTLLLGGMAVVSFLKFGRNFEATMPPSEEELPAAIPKEPIPSRGAGPRFVLSSIFAAANAAAIETFSNVDGDTVRNGATALLLGGMAATSLVNRLRDVESAPVQALVASEHQFAEVGAPVAEFPSLEAERAVPGRLSPVIVEGAAATPLNELFAIAAAKSAAKRAEAAAILNQPWGNPAAAL